MHLKCGGGSFNYCFSRNLLTSLSVKDFENRSALGKIRGKNIVAPFSGHGVEIKKTISTGFPRPAVMKSVLREISNM